MSIEIDQPPVVPAIVYVKRSVAEAALGVKV
jgi:hypothetical protein